MKYTAAAVRSSGGLSPARRRINGAFNNRFAVRKVLRQRLLDQLHDLRHFSMPRDIDLHGLADAVEVMDRAVAGLLNPWIAVSSAQQNTRK